MGVEVRLRRFTRAAQEIADADVVVQTAPAGAADGIAAGLGDVLGTASLRADQVLLDVVYDPWPTPLAAAWQHHGGAVAAGWLMLLHQAVEQVRLMTGRQVRVAPMREALSTALATR